MHLCPANNRMDIPCAKWKADGEKQRGMTRRKKIFLGVAAFIALVSVTIAVLHFRAKWRLEDYKKQLIASGEKLSISELVPPHSTSPNSLNLLVKAANSAERFGKYGPFPMQLSKQGQARVAWRQPQ